MPLTANGVAQPFGASWGSTCWHLTSYITVSETLGNWQLGVNRISKAEQLGSACYVWWLCAYVLQSFAGHVPESSEMPLTTVLKTFRLQVITPSNFKLFAATVVLQYQGRQWHNFFWLSLSCIACSFRATAVSTPSQDSFVALIYICLIFWYILWLHPSPPHSY